MNQHEHTVSAPWRRTANRLPQELGPVTDLTELKLGSFALEYPQELRVPGAALCVLSSLTRLQSLSYEGPLSGPLPVAALCRLAALTRLSLDSYCWAAAGPPPQLPDLGGKHLSALSALSSIQLDGVTLSASTPQLRAAWPALEELSLNAYGDKFALDGLWAALPALPRLTSLHFADCSGQHAPRLGAALGRCSRLQQLSFSSAWPCALPQLPTALTSLSLDISKLVGTPSSLAALPNLKRLDLSECGNALLTRIPDLSQHSQLEAVSLVKCPDVQYLPAPLAILPALTSLRLVANPRLSSFEGGRLMSILRSLVLCMTAICEVPMALAGASCLTHLNLSENPGFVLRQEGMELLAGLPELRELKLGAACCAPSQGAGARGHLVSQARVREALPRVIIEFL